MNNLKEYIYKTLENIAHTGKYSDHLFRSNFPDSERLLISKHHFISLCDAVMLIFVYNKNIDMSDFQWLRELKLDTVISVYNHRELVWNLNNVLQMIELDLKINSEIHNGNSN